MNVTVNPDNDPPVAVDDALTTQEDTPLTITTASILGNDSDIDVGDSFESITITGLPADGELLLNGVPVTPGQVVSVADLDAGQLVFQPTPAGSAINTQFTYTVSDGEASSNEATVSINVTPVADVPSVDFPSASVTVSVNPEALTQTIGSVVGDEAGDNNIEGTPGISYVDGTSTQLNFGPLFAGVTVQMVFNVTASGSWNFDGSGGNFDDFWEVQVGGVPTARFFYNANIVENSGELANAPGGAAGSSNELSGGDNFSYGSPQTRENSNMNFTHDTPSVDVTLDANGQATIEFAGSTTQTSEIATINSATVMLDVYTYEIPIEAALQDLDGSEGLSISLSGVPTDDSFGGISLNNGFTLTETAPGSGTYDITGGNGLTVDTVLTLTVRAPQGNPPEFDLTLLAVATESDGSTEENSVTISVNGETVAPIALDLDGDGLEYLDREAGVVFEDQVTGETMSTAWVGPDDGLLVFDANNSGTVDEAREYVFTRWSDTAQTDMEALAEVFDTDGNRVLDANDEAWSQFGVWQDKNSDGITDPGELRTLDELGVESISLNYADDSEARTDADGDVIVHGQSEVQWTDGSVSTAEDTSFVIDAADVLTDGGEIVLPAGEDGSASTTVEPSEQEAFDSPGPAGEADIAALEMDLLLRAGEDDKPEPSGVE